VSEGTGVIWYGDAVKGAIRSETAKRVDRGGRSRRDYIRVKLGRSQPVRIYSKNAGRSRKGMSPSQPGEYPKKVLGNLWRNIQMEMDLATLSARVGTNVLYGKFLELGTQKMARRPWLSRGLHENIVNLRMILEGRAPAALPSVETGGAGDTAGTGGGVA